jgi:glycine/sarcosine N-methyltransferase
MEFYDKLGGQYNLMIDWKSRLEHETPFFERIFSELKAESVLDAGCGTGRHAVLYSKLGLRAFGFDPSREMVRLASEYAQKADAHVEFRHADFEDINRVFKRKFHVVTCIGNTLPHLRTHEELRAALRQMAEVTRKHGALIIQNRNYDKICKQQIRFAPAGHAKANGSEVIFLRITEFHRESLVFSILTLERKAGTESWATSSVSTELRPWKQRQLSQALRDAGYEQIDFYENYLLDTYRKHESDDLVVVARK